MLHMIRGAKAAAVLAARARATPLVLLAAGIGGASLLDALNLASRLEQTSDSAQSFVAGYAVAHGNILLSGWNVPLDDYYFTDTIPYAVLEWFFGPRPFLLALVPALTYALLVFVGLIVCLEPARPLRRNVESGAALALMLAGPGWIGTWNPLLMSDMHFATVVGTLIALALCARVAEAKPQNARKFAGECVALAAVACATVASDPFGLVFAFGPALALLAAEVILGAQNARAALFVLAGGVALGLVLPALVALAGGFTTENITVAQFVGWPLIGRNLIALLAGILSLFGANPLAAGFSGLAILFAVLRAAALAIVAVAVVHVVRRLRSQHRAPLFDRMLCAGMLTVLAACALSTQFGKGISPKLLWVGGPPMRYAMPAVLFASIVGARRIPELLSRLRSPRAAAMAHAALVAVAGLTVFASGASAIEAAPLWIWDNPALSAARWLEQRGLTEGVGEYWSSNLLTAVSGNAVHVRSVVPLDGTLVPYVLAADRSWYTKPAQFVIWRDVNLTGVTLDDVRATYNVCRMAFVGGYRIAVFSGVPCKR